MSGLRQLNLNQPLGPSCAASPADLNWYAVYTRARHENSVARQLELRAIEHFLPLYERVSRWKDRRVKLQVPLFSGYVFVRIGLHEKLSVLQVPGVAHLVGFGGRPAALPEDEMRLLREGLRGTVRAFPCPYLQPGRRARISCGPFAGLEGTLLRKKGNFRLILSLELIQRSIAVEVNAADVAAMQSTH